MDRQRLSETPYLATEPAPESRPASHACTALSRREFARLALAATAAAALTNPVFPEQATAQSAPQEPPLSAAARAEAERRVALVLARYGHRLTPVERREVRRLIVQMQAQVETLRAYRLNNGDTPATRFVPYRPASE
jgi:hypothetical protein